jgi:hypothetical protein
MGEPLAVHQYQIRVYGEPFQCLNDQGRLPEGEKTGHIGEGHPGPCHAVVHYNKIGVRDNHRRSPGDTRGIRSGDIDSGYVSRIQVFGDDAYSGGEVTLKLFGLVYAQVPGMEVSALHRCESIIQYEGSENGAGNFAILALKVSTSI